MKPRPPAQTIWSLLGAFVWLPFAVYAEGPAARSGAQDALPAIRAGVLSSLAEPGANSSQGLYIRILREAGFATAAVSGEAVKAGALDGLDIFIIGGGSGTKFNTSLGRDGCARVEKFVRKGGGVLASCAGGYSFVRGHNEALSFLEIANARCVDTENGRWARGKGVVEIAPGDADSPPLKMFYANGPIWEITAEPGFGVTAALATFVTEVKKEGHPGGAMAGTPAILGGTFGKGRYVLFSAHPEFHARLGNHPLIVDAAHWVVRGALQAGETVDWKSVFPCTARKAGKP